MPKLNDRMPGNRHVSSLRLTHSAWTLLLLGVVVVPAGCSKDEIKAKLEQAQTKLESVAESTMQKVEEQLPESGNVKLEMTPAAEVGQADLELISIGDGRPNVVQILTYDASSTTRTFPSVMLHGTTTATSASALAGETVNCDMYLQTSPTAPIAMTKPGGSIAVTFGSLNVDDNALSATLGVAELIGSDDKPVQIRGGEIIAVVRGEGN